MNLNRLSRNAGVQKLLRIRKDGRQRTLRICNASTRPYCFSKFYDFPYTRKDSYSTQEHIDDIATIKTITIKISAYAMNSFATKP